MSRDLLPKWLNIPASPWPPDHYALLGLQPGEGSIDDIEHSVLERMEKLRHYQLMHPDQVTEGMNLLAQAMIALTDPETRSAYDISLGLRSAPTPVGEKEPRATPRKAPRLDKPAAPAKPRKQESSAVVAPSDGFGAPITMLPAEPPLIFAFRDSESESAAPQPTVLEALPEDIVIPELDEPVPFHPPEEEIVEESEPYDEGDERERRRKLYAKIVRIRRVLKVWERLREFLEDPNRAFSRRTEIVAFMACIGELRPLLPTVADLVGGPDLPGNLIATLTKQQLVVEMFRLLLPSQRGALAQDCRLAHDELLGSYRRLREEIQRRNTKSFARRVWRPMRRAIIARPEWILLLFGILALIISFFRSLPK